jgi:hypothetical protein
MLDQENNKTHVEPSAANINTNMADPNCNAQSNIHNNPLNDHDYCNPQRAAPNSREHQNNPTPSDNISNIIREKRQRKEVNDPEFSQFTSSSEYSSSDAGSDRESEVDSEDDPNRPWCVCEKPDDGNFMIECEICKYWFHGSCVGVTQAMSNRMARQGKEWLCSSCDHAILSGTPRNAIPLRFVKKEKKKTNTKSTRRRGRPRKSETITREVATRQSLRSTRRANSSIEAGSKTKDKSNARVESFEKFDDQQRLKELIRERKKAFFRKHRLSEQLKVDKMKEMGIGRHSLTAPLGHSLDSLASNTSSPNMNNLPINIKSDHKERSKPNIVLQINTKKDGGTETSGQRIVTAIVKKRKSSESRDSSVNELFTADPIQLNKKSKSQQEHSSTPSKTKVSGDSMSPDSTTKVNVSNEQHDQQSAKKRKRKGSESNSTNGSKSIDSAHIAQKIKECLDDRGKKLDDFDMAKVDTEALATEIENQLNECFKMGSSKYMPKFRSLIFNLSDQKNQALVRNVLTGEIPPSRLVRMSPEEMAPNELSKWRERENKHSIELIKRDAELAAQQVIVKKTHKGEEVIAAPGPNDPDDPTAAKEDQELPSTPTKTSVKPDVPKLSNSPNINEVSKTSSSVTADPPQSGTHNSPEKPETEAPSISSANLEAPQSNGKQHASKEDDDGQPSTSEQQSSGTHETDKISIKNEQAQEAKIEAPKRLRISIDTRLNPANISRLTEPLIKPAEKPPESVEYSPSKISPNAGFNNNDDNDVEDEEEEELYDPETSTIPKRISNESEPKDFDSQCWSGTISMSEVGKFNAMAKPVSGDLDFLKNEISQTLMVCGRIAPDQVTSYIKKLKSTTKNQIFLIQLHPLTENDKVSFDAFFDYLYTRNRCGVINTNGHQSVLKDFYVLPIHERGHIPEILKPINGPGLDRKDPNCLLGLLVKPNRPSSASSFASSYTPSIK